jgi:AraC-like DNA-binding protein
MHEYYRFPAEESCTNATAFLRKGSSRSQLVKQTGVDVRQLDTGSVTRGHHPKGILYPGRGGKYIAHRQILPSAELGEFVEHFWSARWTLPSGMTYRAEVLPYPSMHIVVEGNETTLTGVPTRRFTRCLVGAGWVFGIKFRPAMAYPFHRGSAATMTDHTRRITQIAGESDHAYTGAIIRARGDVRRARIAEKFLKHRLTTEPDPRAIAQRDLVERVRRDRAIIRVDELAAIGGVSPRHLQRNFLAHIGVTPKWVIMRFRLHEAADALANDPDADIVAIAGRCGYFDQPHFAREFKRTIGETPRAYVHRCRAARMSEAPEHHPSHHS